MGQAAHAIGNTELEDKFTKSLDLLERPNTVVFNPSYVADRPLWRLRLRMVANHIQDCISERRAQSRADFAPSSCVYYCYACHVQRHGCEILCGQMLKVSLCHMMIDTVLSGVCAYPNALSWQRKN